MRFKAGLLVGGAVGYVLGTKAGRERYDQIRAQYQNLKRSEPAQQISNEVQRVTDRAKDAVEQKANEGADAVTDFSRDKV
jgi:hypothetical protein